MQVDSPLVSDPNANAESVLLTMHEADQTTESTSTRFGSSRRLHQARLRRSDHAPSDQRAQQPSVGGGSGSLPLPTSSTSTDDAPPAQTRAGDVAAAAEAPVTVIVRDERGDSHSQPLTMETLGLLADSLYLYPRRPPRMPPAPSPTALVVI